MLRRATKQKVELVEIRQAAFGKGVFSLRDFPVEHRIARIAGRVIDDADYGSEYCMDLGGTLSLEPRAPYRYLNHSCDPNCTLVLEESDDKQPPRMFVETLRRVAAEEELTIDYCWTADASIRCGCNSLNCRGWIVDPDEISLIVTGD